MTYDEIIDLLERSAEGVAPSFKPWVKEGIKILRENKDVFRNASETVILGFLDLVSRGDKGEAKEYFIRNVARADDLIDGMEGSAEEIRNAPSDLESALDGLLSVFTKTLAGFLLSIIRQAMK